MLVKGYGRVGTLIWVTKRGASPYPNLGWLDALDACTSMTYIWPIYTVIETPTFTEDAKVLWFEDDRGALIHPRW